METVVAALCGVRDRAWRALPAVLGACALVVLGAGTARAQVTLPSDPVAPLEGSMFQGGDGDQDDAPTNVPPYVDWQDLQQSKRVVHSPDTGWQFGPGSKQDSPGGWSLIPEGPAGVNPAKDNIFDAWSAVDQPGTNTFLYLGFTREKAEGTTTLPLSSTRTRGRGITTTTPRRRDPLPAHGDVLVVFDAHGNDPAWTCTWRVGHRDDEVLKRLREDGSPRQVASTKGPAIPRRASNPGPIPVACPATSRPARRSPRRGCSARRR